MQQAVIIVLVTLSLCFAQSVIIDNGNVRVTAITTKGAEVDTLSETHEAVDEKGQWIKLLSFGGASIITASSSQAGIKYNAPVQLSSTKLIVSGTVVYHYGQDLPGDDVRRILLPLKSTASACAALCAQESTCKTYVFVKEGWEPDTPQPACFLKQSLPVPKRDDCCISPLSRGPSILFNRTITIVERNLVNVEEAYYNAAGVQISLQSLENWFSFEKEPVDFAWSQSVKRQVWDVIPHWQYKSPAVMLQSARNFAALVPNVNALTATSLREQPTIMDLENDGSNTARFSYGVASSKLTAHSTYSRDLAVIPWGAGKTLNINFFLLLSAQEQVKKTVDPITGITSTIPAGFQTITDMLWTHFGGPLLHRSPNSQTNFKNKDLNLFESWRQDSWHVYVQKEYFEFPCNTSNGGSFTPLNSMCASIRSGRTHDTQRHGTNQDMWLNSWFQTVRSAYGMFLYGQSTNDARIKQQAQGIVNLALLAPQDRGAFPTIFWLGANNSMNWNADSGWAGLCSLQPNHQIPPNCQDYYHTFDMAWTGYWLLRWLELTPDDTRILPFAERLGRFLIEVQAASGVIPSWHAMGTFEQNRAFREVNSETAGCGLFLAVLYQKTQNKDYLIAAQKAMSFIEREIITTRRWFDFETFVSCSNKPLSFYDGYTRQQPENNLGKIQAAQAFSQLYAITKDEHYLEVGLIALDYLSLTQQVYTHPLLTPNLIGGFTTQNSDAEWSDARQAQAGDVYFEFYKHTGKLEYLERGVAAMRSSYAVAPFENWAHTGGAEGDEPGAFTGFHWCQGSATTSVEMTRSWLMDAYVSGGRGHMVGVNGCSLDSLSISDTKVEFNIVTPYKWTYDLVVVVDELPSGNYDLQVNGNKVGTFTSDQLTKGVGVKPSYFQ